MKKSSPSDNPLISESISLFQALEVRHDDEPQDAVSRDARNRKLSINLLLICYKFNILSRIFDYLHSIFHFIS